MFQSFHRLPRLLEEFVEKRPILCVLIVIVYVVSPIDVLPEALLGPLGYFDDALVTIAAVALLKRAAKTRLAKRAALAAAEPVRQPPPPTAPVRSENRRLPERPLNQGNREHRDDDRARPHREGEDRSGGRRGSRRRRGRRRHGGGGHQRPPA